MTPRQIRALEKSAALQRLFWWDARFERLMKVSHIGCAEDSDERIVFFNNSGWIPLKHCQDQQFVFAPIPLFAPISTGEKA